MVKRILFVGCLLFCGIVWAQENGNYPKTGILRLNTTISPGWMTSERIMNIYVHSTAAYYLSEEIALYSGTYLFVDQQTQPELAPTFHMNHSTFAGISYHFTNGQRFDPFVSFQPGAAYAQITEPFRRKPGPSIVSPLLGVGGGAHYFVSDYFHFFLTAKYVHGTHLASGNRPYRLNGVRISGGLGLNFRLIKSKE